MTRTATSPLNSEKGGQVWLKKDVWECKGILVVGGGVRLRRKKRPSACHKK